METELNLTHLVALAAAVAVRRGTADVAAHEVAFARAGRAYEGFLSFSDTAATLEERKAAFVAQAVERAEGRGAEIRANLFNPDYLHANDLVFIGSPQTVTEKLMRAASEGVFNCFMGEFNFADLAEDDLMRSIRLFGEKVMPELRAFEPY